MSLEGFDSNCKIAFTVKDTIKKILLEELTNKENVQINTYQSNKSNAPIHSYKTYELYSDKLDEICEKIAKRIDDEI